jgi:hypothetical protein
MSGEVVRLLLWGSFYAIGRKHVGRYDLIACYTEARMYSLACIVEQFPRTIWISSFDGKTPIEYVISHETIHQVLLWLDRPACDGFDRIAGDPDMARTEYGGL